MGSEQLPKKPRTEGQLPVVLGSSSRWRRGLFERHFPEYGTDFLQADIDEKAIRRDCPKDMTLAIARAKADALLPRLEGREVLLVCMDQVIACEGAVREKPETEAEARAFLESYRQGKPAQCINGLVVHNTRSGRRVSCNNVATVHWRAFPDSVIEELIKKGDIFHSAGGFTVEDPLLAPYIDRIEGTADSVQGLPVRPLQELLLRAAAPSPTHVLFDMDGLLLDTEDAYTSAQQEILDRFGRKFTWDIKAKMMGKKALEACQLMIDELGLQGQISAEEFLVEREKRLKVLFADSKLLPGVERLVRHLHRQGVPMAIATSSYRDMFELKTGHHKELISLMHHVTTGDQVKASKPDPEIFNLAASLFDGEKPSPNRVLVFEDAGNGVQAARAAGMQACHVPDPNLGQEHRGSSFGELASLEDFQPEEWGLPPF